MTNDTKYGTDVLRGALFAIDPNGLGYDGWLAVAMAAHQEGLTLDDCREWLDRHGASYDARTFEQKWRSFGHGYGAPVTGGTLVKMARDNGWKPPRASHALDAYNLVIGADDDEPAIAYADAAKRGEVPLEPMFPEGHGSEEMAAYLDAMFEPDDYVRYVLDADFDPETDKKPRIQNGVYKRTAGEIIAALGRSPMAAAIGSAHPEYGAWVCINALDGEYTKNENVVTYRHALVESDDMPTWEFASIIDQLNLPVTAMVDSGNKSLHALVRVDAANAKQYRERVDELYAVCKKNGIIIDEANKNPSRLSRLPGVMRGKRRQALVSLRRGAESWDAWREWYAEATDELPDVDNLADVFAQGVPDLAPALIDGVLRQGHKMLLAGPSKAGKSFALINLCIALAEGAYWMGFPVRQSRVMYVNLELDKASCLNRFKDVYDALGLAPEHVDNIDVWNLRGRSEPMDRLLPKLVRRVVKSGAKVVVIDPVYKVMAGDENSAGDMAAFARLFDRLAHDGACSVIYCHHHSKGAQGDKRSIDRASGSGVFGRDPDAIIDMVELDVDEQARWGHANKMCCAACRAAMDEAGKLREWYELDERDREIEKNALLAVKDALPMADYARCAAECARIKDGKDTACAFRISGTLREFPGFKPVDCWFDWPLHVVDESLGGAAVVGAEAAQRKGRRGWTQEDSEKAAAAHRAKAHERHDAISEAIAKAYSRCVERGMEPTVANVYEVFPDIDGIHVTQAKVKEWTKERNASWCPVQKTERTASDGKSKLLGMAAAEDWE